MIMGSNKVFEHAGRKFHLQAEDLGDAAGAFEVRVYEGGTVLWLKRFDHAEAEPGLSAHERELALRTRMERTLITVEAAIAKGKIP
jgi:hypothetical protein